MGANAAPARMVVDHRRAASASVQRRIRQISQLQASAVIGAAANKMATDSRASKTSPAIRAANPPRTRDVKKFHFVGLKFLRLRCLLFRWSKAIAPTKAATKTTMSAGAISNIKPHVCSYQRLCFCGWSPSSVPPTHHISRAFNADSARALSRSSVDGDIPRIYADYVKQAGIAESHPTIMDLAEQMNATVGRDRTDRVLHGIVGQLPADQAKELLGGAVPAERPLGVKVADLSDDHDQPLFRVAVNQYAKADTGTMNDAAPDVLSPPAELPQGTEKPANDGGGSKPVQTAMAPAVAAGAVALGGLTAGILGEKLPEAMEKTRKWWENQTTTVDPGAGKPQVLTGPDPSKPQIPQAIPPSTPPQQVPPLPPSMAQTPNVPKLEGRPAEPPRKPDVYDYRELPKPLDHSAGEKPHADTQKGIGAKATSRSEVFESRLRRQLPPG